MPGQFKELYKQNYNRQKLVLILHSFSFFFSITFLPMPLVVVWVNRWTFSSPPSPSPSPSHHQICQRPLTKTWFQQPLTIVLCTVLYCTVLYCTVLYCTVLYCTVLYCTVLYCTVQYCTVKKKKKKKKINPPPKKKIQNKGGLNCTVDHGSCAADALLFVFTSFIPLLFTVSKLYKTVLYLLSFEAFNDGMYSTNMVYFDCSPGIQQPRCHIHCL